MECPKMFLTVNEVLTAPIVNTCNMYRTTSLQLSKTSVPFYDYLKTYHHNAGPSILMLEILKCVLLIKVILL